MKHFSLSTILGLTFGILLAFGVAVSAFQSPTQAPPGGNVPAPLNVGAGSQVKAGGLWVGSLGVDGGVQVGGSIKIGGFATLPTCDTARKGSLVFNTNIKKISVCTGIAWEVFSTGIDFDGDGILAGTDCNDGDNTKWQFLTGYADSDGDTRTLSGTSVCSGATLPSPYLSTGSVSVDCDDTCPTCYPGSTSVTPTVDGKDQDCDGTVDENDSRANKFCTISSGGNDNVTFLTGPNGNSACASYCSLLGGSVTPSPRNQASVQVFCGGFNFNTCQLSLSGSACGWTSTESGSFPGECAAATPSFCWVRDEGVTCTCTPAYR